MTVIKPDTQIQLFNDSSWYLADNTMTANNLVVSMNTNNLYRLHDDSTTTYICKIDTDELERIYEVCVIQDNGFTGRATTSI